MSTTCDKNYWIGSYVPDSGGGGGTTPIYRSLQCITTDAFLASCSTSLKMNGVPVNLADYAQYAALLQNQTATAIPTQTIISGDGFRTPALTTGSLDAPLLTATSAGGLISVQPITVTGTSSFSDAVISTTTASVISQWFEPLLTSGNSVNFLMGTAATSGNAALIGTTVDVINETDFTMGIYRGNLSRQSVTPRIDQKYVTTTATISADIVPRFLLKSNGLIPRRTWSQGAVQLATAATQYVRFTLAPVTDMKRIILLFQNIKKIKGATTTCPCVRISSTTSAVTSTANYIGTTTGNQGASMTNWNDGGTNGGIMLWNTRDFSGTAADQSYTGVVEFTRQAPRGGSVTEDWWTVSGSVVSSVNPTSNRPYFSMLSGQVFLSGADVSNIFLTSITTSSGNYQNAQGWVNILWY